MAFFYCVDYSTHHRSQADRLFTTDTKALHHILQKSFDYQKPEFVRWSLARVVGHGLIVVEGEKHRQQVRDLVSGYNMTLILIFIHREN